MGWGSKKQSLSADELMDVRGTAKGLTAKEMKQLKDKADGKVSRGGDIAAGLRDLKAGRKGTPTPPPPQRSGRSMWGKDTPLKGK